MYLTNTSRAWVPFRDRWLAAYRSLGWVLCSRHWAGTILLVWISAIADWTSHLKMWFNCKRKIITDVFVQPDRRHRWWSPSQLCLKVFEEYKVRQRLPQPWRPCQVGVGVDRPGPFLNTGARAYPSTGDVPVRVVCKTPSHLLGSLP